jgi:hypothetical protein
MIWNPSEVNLSESCFILKIKGVEEKSQLIKIDVFDLIWDLCNRKKALLLHKYQGREVYGEYLGLSRIEGLPVFKINTLSIDRDYKISQILK